MASSDEEGEIVPDHVTNYHLVNSRNAPISFSELPLYWCEQENMNGDSSVVYLVGKTDGGLQAVYKEVIGWKLELSDVMPQVYMLSKGKTWIMLQKPRKSYEEIIKAVLVVVHCLHFVKRNIEATRERILSHLTKTLSSYDLAEPVENYLSAQVPLIRSAVAKHKDLAKSKYLETFLMEIENPGRRETLHEGLKENQRTIESKFIVSEDDMENEDDLDDEAEGLFDSVCAFCDNGGDVLPCEGQCLRSFHPTVDAGADTNCESLGFADASEYEAIQTFLCANCKHQRHQCYACGMLGSSDKTSAAEVFPCVSATCGHFYHPNCVAKLLFPSDETLAKQLESQIAAGESFTCPIHKCHRCKGGEDKEVHELQFAVCRRCPKAYHRKCLPRRIAFEHSADGTVQQRAWDDLLPKRILMYCMKHKILPSIWTPKRDHLLFPHIRRNRNQDGSRTKMAMLERRSKAFGNLEEVEPEKIPQVVERRCGESGKSSTIFEKRSFCRNSEQPSTMVHKSKYRDMQGEQHSPPKPVKNAPPLIDNDMKRRILKLMKDATSSFDDEEFIKEKKSRRVHKIYSPQTGLDKTITMGKVEASVMAVRAAMKKREEGGSVEDAKAVCEPNVLNQLIRWKKKLRVFLAPFLHGARYTSFGRHFTKTDKLKEIVNRLHWYVDNGDMIVDFCCGSNDFSCFMKEKLDSMGKKCSFKNYDVIVPKNTFNFEKRDWFTVPVDALPAGSRLVIGLNPPFGVNASLANQFIDHALKFKPKLLILIAPKETKRLDQKRCAYDLIWEEEEMLSGKSFYLPGSINVQDQQLDDWNVTSPPLSLWSRPDWTAKHQRIAEKRSHVKKKQNKIHQGSERVVSNYLMEEKHDCYGDFSNIMTEYQDMSTILDDVPEAPDMGQPGSTKSNPSTTNDEDTDNASAIGIYNQETLDDIADIDMDVDVDVDVEMYISSPVTSSTGSRCGPRVDTLSIQPSHPGFGLPQYANASVPYGSGTSCQYAHPVQNAFPSHPGTGSYYGQGDFTMQPPLANYGRPIYPTHTYTRHPAPTFIYGQPDLSSNTDIWPPGTMPLDRRYG